VLVVVDRFTQKTGVRALGTGLVALGLLFAACGGSSVTRSAYIKQIDGLCNRFTQQFNNLPTATPADLQNDLNKVRSSVQQLAGVPQPSDDRGTLSTIYGNMNHVIDLAGQLIRAQQAGDSKKVGSLETQGSHLSQQVAREWKSYGATACSSATG